MTSESWPSNRSLLRVALVAVIAASAVLIVAAGVFILDRVRSGPAPQSGSPASASAQSPEAANDDLSRYRNEVLGVTRECDLAAKRLDTETWALTLEVAGTKGLETWACQDTAFGGQKEGRVFERVISVPLAPDGSLVSPCASGCSTTTPLTGSDADAAWAKPLYGWDESAWRDQDRAPA